MSYTTPKYGLVVPSPATRLNQLGTQLQQMGISIEEVLDSFDYNGADPNLVLTRVTALEAWRTAAQAQVAALEAKNSADTADFLPLPGSVVGALSVSRAEYKIKSGWAQIKVSVANGGLPPGGVDVWSNIPSWLRPAANTQGAVWLQAGYPGIAFVRPDGTINVSHQAGSNRTSAQFTLNYPYPGN